MGSKLPVANVSSRIKEAMDLRGMRQVDLVEKTGISKSLLSQYLSGRVTNARTDKVYMMAKALRVDAIWLMGFDVPMEIQMADADKMAELTMNPVVIDYAWKVLQMNDTQKNIIFGMIDQLTDKE